ncbi:hypothetical protein BLOT_013517 [Blomia tropicalis]|nr:hypothetical protein BLOT_013517 [Blomia tropicalis]
MDTVTIIDVPPGWCHCVFPPKQSPTKQSNAWYSKCPVSYLNYDLNEGQHENVHRDKIMQSSKLFKKKLRIES